MTIPLVKYPLGVISKNERIASDLHFYRRVLSTNEPLFLQCIIATWNGIAEYIYDDNTAAIVSLGRWRHRCSL